jgi:hypothetical protein
MMLLVVSDPATDGAPVATCQLSHEVVAQALIMKCENARSLDEIQRMALGGVMIEEFTE